ncbi:MAG: hypothetical protein WCX32_04770 [Clostridia bacterium]|jgi:hypothetical protein|nr:hypothetical protein [Clostridia bacterium]
MNKLTEIERKLKEIDPATFEQLTSLILYHYYNSDTHIDIGRVQGEQKTRKGTPDIFLSKDNKNIACQCSTEKLLDKKLFNDIKKCFSLSNDKNIKLDHIVFVCNSSIGIKELQDCDKLCSQQDCSFSFWGIEKISHYLFINAPFIAKEILKIDFGNSSLKNLEEYENSNTYIQEHDIYFQNREKETQELLELLNNNNVIICGNPGDGKTRIALELSKIWQSQKINREVYILNNQSSDIISDLNFILKDNSKEILLLIDDANRTSTLSVVADKVIDCNNLKFIATVRNYAKENVKEKLFNASINYKLYELKALTMVDIKKILKQKYPDLSDKIIDYLMQIARGNLRFSLYAAQSFIKKEKFKTIEELIEHHFNNVLSDKCLSDIKCDNNKMIVLGIIALFQKINLEDNDFINKISKVFKINKNSFIENLNYWYSIEIVDILFDKTVVTISDQILCTYLFYLSFIKNKYVDIITIFDSFFPEYQNRLVDAISSVYYVYPDAKKLTEVFVNLQKKQVLYTRKSLSKFSYIFNHSFYFGGWNYLFKYCG